MNPSQLIALQRLYYPLIEEYKLPMPTVPKVPHTLADENRREMILEELKESKAEMLILLGDKPIEWFLKYYDKRWKRLSDFQEYGKINVTEIAGRKYQVLPLAHPRQIAQLGRSTQKWFDLHQRWMNS